MYKVICVNGAPGSGKTTFEEYCLKVLGEYGSAISTVDYVKQIARDAGWDGTKNLESRAWLSQLKELLTNAPWGDVPFNKIKEHCLKKEYELQQYGLHEKMVHICFVDVREPQAIDKMKNELGASTLFVSREIAENSATSNKSDANVQNYLYDYYITNNGTKDELCGKARNFIETVMKDIKKSLG